MEIILYFACVRLIFQFVDYCAKWGIVITTDEKKVEFKLKMWALSKCSFSLEPYFQVVCVRLVVFPVPVFNMIT